MSLFKDEDRTAIIKRLLILFAIIILIFAIINATWYFGYRQRYSIIAKNLEATYLFGENDDDMLRYTQEIGDYTISLKMPEYLGICKGRPFRRYQQADNRDMILCPKKLFCHFGICPKKA